jgi:hypothetical protein
MHLSTSKEPGVKPVGVLELQWCYWLSQDSDEGHPIGIGSSSRATLHVLILPISVARIGVVEDLLSDFGTTLPSCFVSLRSSELPIYQLWQLVAV